MSAIPAIKTERLILAPTVAQDEAALFAAKNDFEIVRMLANVPWPLVASQREPEATPGLLHFSVLLEGAPIGQITLKRAGSGEPARKMARLGYFLGRRYWGKGYASEALGALVEAVFTRPGLSGDSGPAERIGAGVFTDNPASRRVLEKLGFSRAGGYRLPCVSRHAEVEVDDMQITRHAFLRRAGANSKGLEGQTA
ncbi:GNAT family N-acetyltransferase [Afifella sp. IM 167]|uniref:GNAT family N-acetyltransferase n=1 Tax=Afifella sp. IM 167 TaxID=2033586 RepID=UPI001CCD150D|nr:GNAT family N-acetyltransferase [Afifella sp. IM 167]MBZ8131945.1 hypothetical protein [Afifella sp. IM 167]